MYVHLWKERVATAIRLGRFSENDVALAKCFTTCAVGEFLGFGPEIDRYNVRALLAASNARQAHPKSAELQTLGIKFYDAVLIDHPKAAQVLLAQIEQCEIESLLSSISKRSAYAIRFCKSHNRTT